MKHMDAELLIILSLEPGVWLFLNFTYELQEQKVINWQRSINENKWLLPSWRHFTFMETF